MKGIILAGGTGSRLKPLTNVTNKHLLPVGKYPMIFYPIFRLKQARITEILIVTGREHMGDVMELLGSGREYGVEFTFGLLDESYFMYVEDLDYCYRALEKGFNLYHLCSSEIYHKCGGSSGEKVSPYSSYYYYRNSLRFRINRLKGLCKITSIIFYFLRLPLIILKWFVRDRRIIKSVIRGTMDGIRI